MSRRRRPIVRAVPAVIGLALVAPATALARSSSLERGLLSAVRAAGLHEVIDFGPVDDACPYGPWCPSPAPTISSPPNVDVAVIELRRNGRARRAANRALAGPSGGSRGADRPQPRGERRAFPALGHRPLEVPAAEPP